MNPSQSPIGALIASSNGVQRPPFKGMVGARVAKLPCRERGCKFIGLGPQGRAAHERTHRIAKLKATKVTPSAKPVKVAKAEPVAAAPCNYCPQCGTRGGTNFCAGCGLNLVLAGRAIVLVRRAQ